MQHKSDTECLSLVVSDGNAMTSHPFDSAKMSERADQRNLDSGSVDLVAGVASL